MTSRKIIITAALISVTFGSASAQDTEKDRIALPSGRHFLPELVVKTERPSVALVLSGGGSRGIAHVGVLKVLEKHGIPIDFIIGSSMGSIVGGLYASGYSAAQLEKLTIESDWENLLVDKPERKSLLTSQQEIGHNYIISLRFDGWRPHLPLGFIGGQKLTSMLNDFFIQALYKPEPDFDDLKIPFRSVATDLKTGDAVVFSEGDIVEALRASIAIPLILSPVRKDGMILVDGGISNSLPTDIARDLGVDVVIAVDASSPLRPSDKMVLPWQVADQIITIMMQSPMEERRKLADVLIKPDLEDRLPADFSDIAEIIRAGEEAAESALQKIFSVTAQKSPSGDLASVEPFPSSDSGESSRAQPPVSTIGISGITLFEIDTLKSDLNVHIGQDIEHDAFHRGIEKILTRYREAGYSLATVRYAFLDSVSDELFISIDEGVINSIEVEGNEFTSAGVLLREFPLDEGDIFNRRRAQRGIENIYATKLFNQAALFVDHSSTGYKLIIRVEEKKYLRLLLGIRTDRERKSSGMLELRHDNLFGRDVVTSITGSFGDRDKYVTIRYGAPRLLNTHITYGVRAGFFAREDYLFDQLDVIGEYIERRTEGAFHIGAQVRRLGGVTGEISFINTKIEGKEDAGFSVEGESRFIAFKFRSVVDTRDRVPLPSKGKYNTLTYVIAPLALGSEIVYTSFIGTFESYSTHFRRLTFHPQIAVGLGDRTMPFSEQFRLGGRKMLYGTREHQIIARRIIYAGMELRYRLTFNELIDSYLTARYDFGAGWKDPETAIHLDAFISGIGGGIIFDTLIGPLSAEWGRTSEGYKRFYLVFGYDF